MFFIHNAESKTKIPNIMKAWVMHDVLFINTSTTKSNFLCTCIKPYQNQFHETCTHDVHVCSEKRSFVMLKIVQFIERLEEWQLAIRITIIMPMRNY